VIKEIRVVGESRLVSTLARAEKALAQMDTTGAAEVIAGAAGTTAPRGRTGRLAGSFGASLQDGRGTIASDVVYAVPIHWGRPAHNIRRNPFVYPAVQHSEPSWVRALEESGQRICDEVEGA